MHYEDFRASFLEALGSSGLRRFTPWPKETMDMSTTDRAFEVYVELPSAEREGQFYANATISWRWSAMLTARFTTTEEDFLTQVFGRDKDDVETEQPVLRIDVELHAGAHPSAPGFVLPEAKVWSRWVDMVNEKLAGPDRPVSDAVTADGIHMSWRGEPEVTVTGDELGHPIVSSITLSAFELIHLPRHWDDPDREPDDDPDEQLAVLFRRLERAMKVWGESVTALG